MKPNELFDLSGEVAIVIGATGALGGALAQGLGEAGAKVAVLGRNAERGQARVKEILSQGGKAAFFVADAVKKESLRAAHEAIQKSLGAPGILVNAAAATTRRSPLPPTTRSRRLP
jgi:NAD(P)-dependent dehydrogenase (short-subunit alcohol dehydrogenase family)